MRKYGLIGYPLGHSFSKKFFIDKFLAEHITDCYYENYPLENLDNFIEFVKSDLELAKQHKGETLFELIIVIIKDNNHIELELN